MFERTISLFSAGKTFSCTGWRVGYAIAPKALTAPMVSLHAATNFCVSVPLQMACTRAFHHADAEGYFEWYPTMLQQKRDTLCQVLQKAGLTPVIPEGGYFICCDATPLFQRAGIDPDKEDPGPDAPLSERPDVRIAKWCAENLKVTPIPVSPFYLPPDRHLANRLIRFAYCKDEATMALAQERLLSLS